MILDHGANSLRRSNIDPDIIILQDWVTQGVGLQPTSGTVPSASFDPDGPLDVSGTGWSGTPYVSNNDIGRSRLDNNSQMSDTDFEIFAADGLVYGDGIDSVDFGNVDYTVEFWAKKIGDRYNADVFRSVPAIGLYNEQKHFCFGFFDNVISVYSPERNFGANLATSTQWHHFAMVSKNNILDIYYDGTKYLSGHKEVTNPFDFTFFSICKIGRRPFLGEWKYSPNYIYAQVCLTKRAKWTENFTPPTKPYCLGV